MTHSDIYTKFMIEYDKANITSSYPSLTKYEVATILDKAYLALIAQKLTGNNARKAPFENDVKAVEDLRPLVKTQALTKTTNSTILATNEHAYSKPNDMLYYISGLTDIRNANNAIDGARHVNQNAKLVTHAIAENFKASETNLPWIKIPVTYLEGEEIRLLTDPYAKRNVYGFYATYIKKPAKFAYVSDAGVPVPNPNPNDKCEHTYYHVFVNVHTEAEGIQQYSSGEYEEGDEITLKCDQSDHYAFEKWVITVNGQSRVVTEEQCKITVEADTTAVAYYVLCDHTGGTGGNPTQVKKFSVTATTSGSGTVSGSGNYELGAQVTLQATPSSGYKFLKWSDGNTNNPRTVVVKNDIEYIAQFAPIAQAPTEVYCTLTCRTNEGGTIIGSGLYLKYSYAVIEAKPYEGWKFKCWNNGNKDNPRRVYIETDTNIHAIFERIPTDTTDDFIYSDYVTSLMYTGATKENRTFYKAVDLNEFVLYKNEPNPKQIYCDTTVKCSLIDLNTRTEVAYATLTPTWFEVPGVPGSRLGGVKVVFNKTFREGDFLVDGHAYQLTIPAATYGDAKFGEYLSKVPYVVKSDCTVNNEKVFIFNMFSAEYIDSIMLPSEPTITYFTLNSSKLDGTDKLK